MEYLRSTYDASFLSSDPLKFPRRYASPADREVVAFLAAGFAFGNVKAIGASLERLLKRPGDGGGGRSGKSALYQSLSTAQPPTCTVQGKGEFGGSPAAFCRAHAGRPPEWSGVAHRWIRGRDAAAAVCILGRMLEGSGSIGEFFRAGDDPASPDVAPGLESFSVRALALAPGRVTRGVRSFFPRPSDGSACKLLNLFLRWMARPDDGLDLGLWPHVRTSRLIIPLDVHMARICRKARLTRRKSPGWRMAVDVTRRLRALDPEDPVKYDFAITRLGILAVCVHGEAPEACGICGLRRGKRPSDRREVGESERRSV